MKKYESETRFDASADAVISLITTPDYTQEEALAEGAVKAESRIEISDSKSIVIITERVDLRVGPSGKYGGKKESSTVTRSWNLETNKSQWAVGHVGPMANLVDIRGETWVEDDGDSCIMHETGSVDIRIPFLGAIFGFILNYFIAAGTIAGIKKKIAKKTQFISKKLNK